MKLNSCLFTFLIITFVSCKKEDRELKVGSNQVLQAYYEAIGGYETLKSVHTYQKTGYYIEPAYQMVWPAKFVRKRPHFRLIGLGPEQPDQVFEGYDGSPWEYHKGEEVIRSEGESAKAMLSAIDFDPLFVDAEEKGYALEYVGEYSHAGRNYHQLRVRLEVLGDEYIADYYFDVETSLLAMKRKVMPIHARGEDVEILSHYSDYREVDGLLVPFTHTERRSDTGAFLNATIWERVEFNLDLPDTAFQPPTSESATAHTGNKP